MYRKLAAVAIAVPLAVLVIGLAGQLPLWGETAPLVFAVAMLGAWTVGSVAWRR